MNSKLDGRARHGLNQLTTRSQSSERGIPISRGVCFHERRSQRVKPCSAENSHTIGHDRTRQNQLASDSGPW